MTLVKVAEITEPEAGSKRPFVVKDGNGTEYKTWDTKVVTFLRENSGKQFTFDTETKQRGNYTDQIIRSAAVHVEDPKPQNGYFRPRDPAEERRIVRQAVIERAIAFHALRANHEITLADVLTTAAGMEAWVYGQGATPAKTTAADRTPENKISAVQVPAAARSAAITGSPQLIPGDGGLRAHVADLYNLHGTGKAIALVREALGIAKYPAAMSDDELRQVVEVLT